MLIITFPKANTSNYSVFVALLFILRQKFVMNKVIGMCEGYVKNAIIESFVYFF